LSKHRSNDEAPFAYNSLWRNDQSGNLLGEGYVLLVITNKHNP